MEVNRKMFKTPEAHNRRYRILELDRDLIAGLDEEAAAIAGHEATAEVATIADGEWEPEFHGDLAGALGLLVLDGLMARTVTVAGRPSTELIVAGDFIRPWQHESGAGLVASEVQWHVLEPARVALLDRRFLLAAGRWPEVMAEIASRGLRRSRCQALSAAITRMSRVDMRLLVLLWHLADRIGRVTPEGVVVPVVLTHEMLAALVGARRPSVTTALSGLSRAGLVLRRPDTRHWLLTPASQEEVERLCGEGESQGETASHNGHLRAPAAVA
jgi:hypothetical protein